MKPYLLLLLIPVALLFFGFSKNKKKVIFFGDSITAAAVKPDGYITHLKRMLDSVGVGKNIELIGKGISGNKVPDLQKRLQKDVLSLKPDLVIIYIGINDVWHFHHECCKDNGGGTEIAEFEAGLKDIIKKIEAKGAKVLLCTPSVIGEKAPGDNELDEQLDQYSEVSRRVASETSVGLVDLRNSFKNYIKENISMNQGSGILTYDGVHLNNQGNKLVATEMFPFITTANF